MATEPEPSERVEARVLRAAVLVQGVTLDEVVLREHVRQWEALRPREVGEPRDPVELYLAIACITDARGALDLFERQYLRSAAAAVASYRLTADELDEVCQRVRVRLIVQRRDDVAVLLHCAGDGRLGGLVRMTMVREATRLRSRTRMPDLPLDVLDDEAGAEHQLASDEHQTLLQTAFATATDALDVRARNVLRLHYVRGVSGTQIGRLYGVHRGTAARWLASARTDLLQHVRRTLRELSPELDAWPPARLAELIHSRLDLSLSRVLRE